MKKKTIALLLVLMLVFGVTCGGTIAYLTSTTDTITNTFTVGKVAITLDEALVDVYGAKIENKENVRIPNNEAAYENITGNAYKLIPGHTYIKDPTIHVQPGSEKCYVFVKVENGISDIEAKGTTSIEAQISANGWDALAGESGVYYKTQDAIAATADAANLVIFSNFKLAADAEVDGDEDYAEAEIVITGYAVQFDGLSVTEAWAAVNQ